ncbi:CLUMA_CG014175, isoform A [Clunio marinus]|uniref:CLUMA_CG014175, isoform A n=1 Tax=Clunio marinus TaxID=568069 RepID=A0A1J1IN03_9DIPT|nr:CLUMA_CG014175, isoform A [Clunio marinus]
MSGSVVDWIDFNQKNKPQSNALAGGILTLLVSGIHFGWIFNNDLISYPWAGGHSSFEKILTYSSFFVGGVAGLYFASLVVNRLTKSNIYFSAMTFVSTGSVFFIIMPKSLYLILVARLFIGFGHGYAYLTLIVHASEIVTQKLRGLVVASFNFVIICSVFMCGSFTMSFESEESGFGAIQWMGILGCFFSLLGFLFIAIFTRESPVALIRQKKFDQAVALMIKLRCESEETWSIKNEYNELKVMVEEDEESSTNIFDHKNLRPLIFITLLKIGTVLSFNFGLNMIRLMHSNAFVSEDNLNFSAMAFMGIRLSACMVTLFTIDAKGRRPHFLISYGGSSIILIIMGIVIASTQSSWLIVIVQIIFDIISGVGIGMIADVYSSEAFNTMMKPRSIFFTTSIEYIFHIVLIVATFNVYTSPKFGWIFMIGSGILLLALTYLLYKKLPETAKMSIRQTRNEFMKTGEIVFSGSKMPPQSITFH